jgi:hypothetical protein
MSELSSALGGSVPNHQIVCNGKTYHVSLITQAVKVAFERTLYQKARVASVTSLHRSTTRRN